MTPSMQPRRERHLWVLGLLAAVWEVVPGAILFTALGLGPLGAALLAWRRHPSAPFLALATGVALLIWLGVEIAIVGYSNDPPLQPFYLALGAVITVLGLGWLWRTHRPGRFASPAQQ